MPSVDEIYKVAGKDLSELLDCYFLDKKDLQDWIVRSLPAFGISAYELCEQGRQEELYNKLVTLAQGNVG